MSNIIDVTIDNFDDAMSSKLLVLDFFTNSCQPCKKFLPILSDFADRKVENATYGKVDAEVNVDLVSAFQVRSVPTVIVIKDGIEMARKTGAISADELQALVSNN